MQQRQNGHRILRHPHHRTHSKPQQQQQQQKQHSREQQENGGDQNDNNNNNDDSNDGDDIVTTADKIMSPRDQLATSFERRRRLVTHLANQHQIGHHAHEHEHQLLQPTQHHHHQPPHRPSSRMGSMFH
jgi:hypothetical protein